MYDTPVFREDRTEVLHDLIAAHPFATLVTFEAGGLVGNHLPMILDRDSGTHGTLRAHVARPNPLWQSFDPGVEALAIFQGAEGYITPSWYPSKKAHGKVVPTWNYAVVHAYGALQPVEDPDWLRAHLEALTLQQERDRPVPWAVDDAPDDFVRRMMKGIVGLELSISRLEGKWKVSQNRNQADRQGVSRALRLENGGRGADMAELVERYGRDG